MVDQSPITAALLSSDIEPELKQWLNKFPNLEALFPRISDLFRNLRSNHLSGEIESSATIIGPCHIGDGSIINHGCIILGPVILGEGVVLDPNVIVRGPSYIGNRTWIQSRCTIEKSLILNNSKLMCSSYVGESIIGTQVEIGIHAVVGAHDPERSAVTISSPEFTSIGAMGRIGAQATVVKGAQLTRGSIVQLGKIAHGNSNA